MKYSTSREKLSQMHQELDRQLQMAGHTSKGKRRNDRDQFRYVSEFDENKKSTLSNISNRPPVYDHEVREVDIKSKKNQIGDLQRKLMELEKKMDNFSVSSGDSNEQRPKVKEKLEFKSKVQINANEDTARFLLGVEQRERNHTKFTYECPSFPDEEVEEEDSEDYFEIQQAIQKRKADEKMVILRQSQDRDTLRVRRDSREKKQIVVKVNNDTERKVSQETESHLRPKYPNEKSTRSVKSIDKKSLSKKSMRDSAVSRKSVQKGKSQSRSKRLDAGKKQRPKNVSRDGLNRSMDRSQVGEQITRGEQVQVAKQMKRVNNLERQLQHYKRLARKYKQQLEESKVMQIQFRQLKKNFAKSETIRTQQKKIIESLKSKMNR